MTPEEQIIYAIKYLEEKNQVMDEWHSKGSISYQLGAYFAGGKIPSTFWGRDVWQIFLGWASPVDFDSGRGVRTSVRIS